MWHRTIVTVACWTVSGLLASVPALADPIRVTGGEFTASLGSSSFIFTGDGFALAAGGGEGFATSLFNDCRPCSSAAPIPLSFSSTVPGATFSGGTPGMFNGVTYDHTFLAGDFSFTGPSFSSAVLSPSNLTLTAPFSMTALLQNYASNPLTS